MVGISNVTDVWIKKCKKHGPHTWWEPFLNTYRRRVILSPNCVWLLDTALNIFYKNLFYQKQFKYAMNMGIDQIKGVKKCPFISLLDAAFTF